MPTEPNSHLPAEFGYRGDFSRELGDRQRHAGSTGILQVTPSAVATPADAADVAALAKWAAATRSPLVPRGGATGMPGGNVGEGVAVDFAARMTRIGDPDRERRLVSAQPGVILADLNRHVGPDLRFPVDPSSAGRCTLGGMIANNSAGAHSVKYGATREWVDSLDLVLADGQAVTLRRGHPPPAPIATRIDEIARSIGPRTTDILAAWPRVRKNSSGYALKEFIGSGDPVDLIVGSEGTLALITAASLRLDSVPRYAGLAILEFDDLQGIGAAITRILDLEPAACEFLDRTFLDLVRSAGEPLPLQIGRTAEAVFLVEFEADDSARIAQSLEAVRRVDGVSRATTTSDPDRSAQLWELRHAASPIIARQAGTRISMQFIEDSVVPIDALPAYLIELRAILRRRALPAVIFGHAGDGNVHVNPLVDPTDPGMTERLDATLREVAELVARLGGTLAGEHGDGRLRAPLLGVIWPDFILDAFGSVKNSFDPLGILNPGVILPEPGQTPFATLKRYA